LPAAKRRLIAQGYSRTFGARPLRRTIEDELEHRLAEGILAHHYAKGSVLTVGVRKGELTIDARSEKA
jgi:hypothetical protein